MYGENVTSANISEVPAMSRNDAPSRDGRVVSGQMTKASSKWVLPPLPAPPSVPSAYVIGVHGVPSHCTSHASLSGIYANRI